MTDFFNKINSFKTIEILFSLYVLSIPFGSSFLSISIGFMTIYPNLLLLLAIFIVGVIDYKRIFKFKVEAIFLLFLLFWLLYSIGFLFFVDGKKNAIIDIRSVGVMFLTSYVIIWVKNRLGFEEWSRILAFSFKAIFFMFAIFAAIELMTGLHFVGDFTDKIMNLPGAASFAYAPVFLYDNQNTFVAYFLLFGLLSIILTKDVHKRPYLVFLVTTICFLFAQISLARIGNFTSLLMFVVFFLAFLPALKNAVTKSNQNKKRLFAALFLLLALATVTITNEKFYGPIWENSMMVNAGFKLPTKAFEDKTVIKDSIFGDNYALRYANVSLFEKEVLDSNYNSSKVRAGLLLNGYYFFKENPFTGIGPGQYREKHQTEQQKFYTKTNISPHFWLVEVFSQFGLIILVPYTLFLGWIFVTAVRHLKSNYFGALIVALGLAVFGLTSLLPSSFLILDINWIFLTVLVTAANRLNATSLE